MKEYKSKQDLIQSVADMRAKYDIDKSRGEVVNVEALKASELRLAKSQVRFDNGMGCFPPKWVIEGYGYAYV